MTPRQDVDYQLGTPTPSKTDEFSEKFQRVGESFSFSHPRQGGIRFNTANMMSLFWGYFLVHPWP